MPLDPDSLTPAASLNRLRIVDLPGLAVEAEARGKTGHDLLSLAALAAHVRAEAGALGLVGGGEDAAVALAFDRCFVADDPAIRRAADTIAARFGRRLGYLILTLKRGDGVNRRARPDWDEADWARWAGIQTFWIGGGLAGGRLGPRLVSQATATVRAAGMTECEARLASHPALLPLIGAARSAPPGWATASVFDFGQSVIKRALAVYAEGALVALRLLPPLPARHTAPDEIGAEQARRLAEHMTATIGETWGSVGRHGPRHAPVIVASLAAYARDGQPLPRQGGPYAMMHVLSDNLARWLSERASDRIGRAIEVTLLHDGSAAARTYAGAEQAAVIMLGTAIGVGFPPAPAGLRPLAPRVEIVDTPLLAGEAAW